MSETEWQHTHWLECDDPRALHRFVGERISWRKRGLWLLACGQELWDRSRDEATLAGLALVENVIETSPLPGMKTVLQIPAGQTVIDCDATERIERFEWQGKDGLPHLVDLFSHNRILDYILSHLTCSQSERWVTCDWLAGHFEQAGLSLARQAELYRDIVRAPFRPLHFHAAWRTWQGGIPLRIAQEIYQERAFAHLPILADALEEAGCREPEILDHCRSGLASSTYPGGHVRGCWVVDLVRGRV